MRSEAPHRWLFEHAARAPSAPAIDSVRHRVSYQELARNVRRLAAELLDAGLLPRERVVLALPSSPAAVTAALAVQAAGGCLADFSPRLGRDALTAICDQVGARFAFVSGRDAQLWKGIAAAAAWQRIFVVHPSAPPAKLLELLGASRCTHLADDGTLSGAVDGRFVERSEDPDAPSLILFTSGSTGTPRGVVLSMRNQASNAQAIATYQALTARDRAMLILPLSYAYGRSVLHAHLFAGGSVFLDDRFMYPRLVLEAMGSEGCTTFSGVPATYEVIRRQLSTLPAMPSLRLVTQAGGALARETLSWARHAFAPARVMPMYGQTEATARLAYLPPEHLDAKAGSIGLPIPGTELSVVDGQGRPVAAGEPGELVARGPGVALGYLADAEATASTFRDGWLHTGDLAVRDADGFYFVVGRAKEMLKLCGHRVSPQQIEDVLARHPAVEECAVVGLPDSVEGEVAAAFVVSRGPGAEVADLRRFCREQLPPHMVPRAIAFVATLPRNEAGKLMRRELLSTAGAELLHAQG